MVSINRIIYLIRFIISFLEASIFWCNNEFLYPLHKEILFQKAFDQKKALKEGKITPTEGVDAEFDDATQKVAKIKEQLDELLKKQMKHFGSKVTLQFKEVIK